MAKHFYSLLCLIVSMTALLSVAGCRKEAAEGSLLTSSNDATYYTVKSLDDLQALSRMVVKNPQQDWTIILEADITIDQNTTLNPIGTYDVPFRGSFIGSGHTITIKSHIPKDHKVAGLFGHVLNASITKLRVNYECPEENLDGLRYVGGLVGLSESEDPGTPCRFFDIIVDGKGKTNFKVDAENSDFGGIVGRQNGAIDCESCQTTGINLYTSKRDGSTTGGLVGRILDMEEHGNFKASFTNCSSNCMILFRTDHIYAGGLIGRIRGKVECEIKKCSFTGNLIDTDTAVPAQNNSANETNEYEAHFPFGGIVGRSRHLSMSITECSVGGEPTEIRSANSGLCWAGIVGRITKGKTEISKCQVSKVVNCYITSRMNRRNVLAGFVGVFDNRYNLTISECTFDKNSKLNGDIGSGDLFISGAVGYIEYCTEVEISNCNVSAELYGENKPGAIEIVKIWAGGFVAAEYSSGTLTIKDCKKENILFVTSDRTPVYAGGIIGYSNSATVNCSNTANFGEVRTVLNGNNDENFAGGLAGYINNNIKIFNCCNNGKISALQSPNSIAAGLLGYTNSGEIRSCYSCREIVGQKESFGLGSGKGDYHYCAYLNENEIGIGEGTFDESCTSVRKGGPGWINDIAKVRETLNGVEPLPKRNWIEASPEYGYCSLEF